MIQVMPGPHGRRSGSSAHQGRVVHKASRYVLEDQCTKGQRSMAAGAYARHSVQNRATLTCESIEDTNSSAPSQPHI
jgi:hypothetical protein